MSLDLRCTSADSELHPQKPRVERLCVTLDSTLGVDKRNPIEERVVEIVQRSVFDYFRGVYHERGERNGITFEQGEHEVWGPGSHFYSIGCGEGTVLNVSVECNRGDDGFPHYKVHVEICGLGREHYHHSVLDQIQAGLTDKLKQKEAEVPERQTFYNTLIIILVCLKTLNAKDVGSVVILLG